MLVVKLDEEILVFFGEENVSDVAKKSEHINQIYNFFFNPGAIIWYIGNKIEYVIYRRGVAELR